MIIINMKFSWAFIIPLFLIILVSGCVNTIDEESTINSITSQYQQVSNFDNCEKFREDLYTPIGGPGYIGLQDIEDLVHISTYECGRMVERDERYTEFYKEKIWESTRIIVVRDKDNYYFAFVKGSGDCPSGCMQETGYLFKIDNSGNITYLGKNVNPPLL
jgi:hypothetical protein